MKKFFIVKTEKGYVTSANDEIYVVNSLNKEDAVKFPFDISNKEYNDICGKLHQNGFKNVEFTICFTQ
jgi:hypothetical protein